MRGWRLQADPTIESGVKTKPPATQLTVKTHLNWFGAEGELSSGVVEGLNDKIRVVTRRSYGFRTYRAMEVAVYHNLGHLREPEFTHRFG